MKNVVRRLSKLESRFRPPVPSTPPAGPDPAELEAEFRELMAAIESNVSDEEFRARHPGRHVLEPSAVRGFLADIAHFGEPADAAAGGRTS